MRPKGLAQPQLNDGGSSVGIGVGSSQATVCMRCRNAMPRSLRKCLEGAGVRQTGIRVVVSPSQLPLLQLGQVGKKLVLKVVKKAR
jgi:hypothetical protein